MISVRICASRFCSTTKSRSWPADEFLDFARRSEARMRRVSTGKPLVGQHLLGFVHRGGGRSVLEDSDPGRFRRPLQHRARQQAARGFELALQPLHVVDIGQAFLGVAREPVAAGAAGEIGAARRMSAGQRPIRNSVAVDIVVAAETRAPVSSFSNERTLPRS